MESPRPQVKGRPTLVGVTYEGFFGRLKSLLEAMHGRGVVQGDLHHRDVLVGEGGTPWLVVIDPSRTVIYNEYSLNPDKFIAYLDPQLHT